MRSWIIECRVECANHFLVCEEEGKNDIYVFFTCDSACATWQVAGMLFVLTYEV
jgi:hypothetical protein